MLDGCDEFVHGGGFFEPVGGWEAEFLEGVLKFLEGFVWWVFYLSVGVEDAVEWACGDEF